MDLIPDEPPGNAQRKLRGLLPEIDRLRAEGYTIRVIQKTLLKAGVQVSWATVQRELTRNSRAKPHTTTRAGAPGPPTERPAIPTAPAAASEAASMAPREPHPETMNRMSDVDEFFSRHISNPLFRNKGST